MLSVSEAKERILRTLFPVGTEVLPLEHVNGRVLAETIIAQSNFPPFDNSSMDGFALRSSDVTKAKPNSPCSLKVIADIRAGSWPGIKIEAGQCARITTGAPLPAGADSVVKIEDTDFQTRIAGAPAPAIVSIYHPAGNGDYVRHSGDDLRQGESVLPAGCRLRAQEIGLLAMLGVNKVLVHRPLRAAILSSGDELLPVDVPLMPGKIHDSNTYMISALAEKAGIELIQLGVASDSEADIFNRLEKAAQEKVDLIISSAGVSVGAFDYVKSVVEANGKLDFWQVDMRPGKPLAFGFYHEIPFFGLPGNPVSAFVSFEVFVRPALEKLSGAKPNPRPTFKAYLQEDVHSDGRESYLRAQVTEEDGHLMAHLTGHQGSGNILSLVQANALLIVPSGVKSLPENSEAEIWFIE